MHSKEDRRCLSEGATVLHMPPGRAVLTSVELHGNNLVRLVSHWFSWERALRFSAAPTARVHSVGHREDSGPLGFGTVHPTLGTPVCIGAKAPTEPEHRGPPGPQGSVRRWLLGPSERGA